MELNGYRIMWVFVFFDLPTDTKRDRKNAANFRKNLIKAGFSMFQYSVYVRHAPSSEAADAHERRVQQFIPPKGRVSILRVTDKQFGRMKNFWGKQIEDPKPPPLQLELF